MGLPRGRPRSNYIAAATHACAGAAVTTPRRREASGVIAMCERYLPQHRLQFKAAREHCTKALHIYLLNPAQVRGYVQRFFIG